MMCLVLGSCSDDSLTVVSTVVSSSPSSTTTVTTTTVVTVASLVESPDAIAAAITNAERGIRDFTLSPDATARWGRLQQRAYRALAGHPEWDESVSALLPNDVTAPFALNVQARRAVADHAAGSAPSPPSPTLPAWSNVEPLPIDELLGYYREAEAATGVSWTYLAAINLVETRTGRIVGASSSGAVGPMQFLPSTWAACCTGDVTNPHDAIMGAAVYLATRGAPADMRRALYGYNPNDGYVGAVDAYARNLLTDPRAIYGYHAWEVYVTSSAGTVRLPVGYASSVPQDAAAYVATHPEDLAPVDD